MSTFGTPPWSSAEWGQRPGAWTALPGCDAYNCINDVWFRLGFLKPADLAVAGRWTGPAELYQFADDAVKKLAYEVGAFTVHDASIATVSGTALYSLPATHVFTIMAWIVYAGSSPQMLRMTSVGQLFALDASWVATTGNPMRASLDAAIDGTLTLYPQPVAIGTVNQILQEIPAAVVAGASSIPLSPVMQDYFSYAMLAGARAKESDAAMADMAAHFGERMGLYEKVADHLWGPGA